MFNFILFLLFFLMFVASLFYNIISTLKIKKLIQALFQVNLDYFIVADQLKKSNITDNEAFINFLIKSRDDAFLYIENVQEALKIFKSEIGPLVNYHENFGNVISNPMSLQLDKIVLSYNKLMMMLPEEIKTEESQ